MIAYLKGQIISRQAKRIILLCGDIGYELFMPQKNVEELADKEYLEVFVYTKVREDEISLFAFPKESDLEFFKNLISVSGVGPKTALEIMSAPLEQIKAAISQKNSAFLSKVPGIGKKTAERICVDLQNKVTSESIEELPSAEYKHFREALEALLGLGYQRQEIRSYLKEKEQNTHSAEELITGFLKNR